MSQASLLHCGACPPEKMAVRLAQTKFYLKLIGHKKIDSLGFVEMCACLSVCECVHVVVVVVGYPWKSENNSGNRFNFPSCRFWGSNYHCQTWQ